MTKKEKLENIRNTISDIESKISHETRFGFASGHGIAPNVRTFKPKLRLLDRMSQKAVGLRSMLLKPIDKWNIKRIKEYETFLKKCYKILPSVKPIQHDGYSEVERVSKYIGETIWHYL